MASNLYIAAKNQSTIELVIKELRAFEQKYSRFISGNYLDKLNSSTEIALDDETWTNFMLSLIEVVTLLL